MIFRIANTFRDSLARLPGDEQRVAKTTAFDLQVDPSSPGMKLHRLDRARDKNFWSVRVNDDIRLIVHRSESCFLLCYVDRHDAAYRWAERRKLETHPRTGAAQLVEIRETVREIPIPTYIQTDPQPIDKPKLFAGYSDEDLLRYGVPAEWVGEIREADEDSILELAEHLPEEAAEAVLDLATGVTPPVQQVGPTVTDPFDHPDALRRFRVMDNVDELRRALKYPWEKWTVFLHPAQRRLVERNYRGPARVSGSAGTGKTVVALHRAVHLARTHPDARVLLATFSDTLANTLEIKLHRLISNQPRLAEQVEVHALNATGRRLYQFNLGRPDIVSPEIIQQFLDESALEESVTGFSPHFLKAEWDDVVDAWQLETWEAYRDVRRLGRKIRLPESQRAQLWKVFAGVRSRLKARNLITYADLFSRLASWLGGDKKPPFEFAVVDEAQDISVAQLRFLAALGAGRPNSLFFAGDLGQRIFQQPFSWKSLGVDIRGRSSTLRINYRTSHQIRMQADRLLGAESSDVDGNVEKRGALSVFNGPKPTLVVLDNKGDEIETVHNWIGERLREGVKPHEIGVFVRSVAELDRALEAAEKAGLSYRVLDENVDMIDDHIVISTMHLAKGLEFRGVVVMACDDDVIPLQERIERVVDEPDLEEVYNTERHLLYVACTRARDNLLVTGVGPASEFLDDLQM